MSVKSSAGAPMLMYGGEGGKEGDGRNGVVEYKSLSWSFGCFFFFL